MRRRSRADLQGQWKTDPRTSASIYTTARNAVWPWADPGVRGQRDRLRDHTRLAARRKQHALPRRAARRRATCRRSVRRNAADLIRQAFERYNRTGTPIDPGLLLILDEAANTPLPTAAQWSATITGAGIAVGDGVAIERPDRPGIRPGRRQPADQPPHEAAVPKRHKRPRHDRLLREASSATNTSAATSMNPRGYRTGTGRHRDRSPSTAVPFLAPNVLRQVKVGDALLIHGALPPAWIRARR